MNTAIFIKKIFHIGDKHPNRVAIRYLNELMTYGTLLQDIENKSHFLRKLVDDKRTFRVGICLYKNINCITWILASFLANITCVPINSFSSKEQINAIIKGAQLKLVLTDDIEESVFTEVKTDSVTIVNVDGLEIKASPFPPKKLKNNVAYILYTSGSTGIPKGVKVTYLNLECIHKSWDSYFQLSNKLQTHLQLAHYTFDVFFGDLLRCLPFGHELILCQKKTMLSPEKLYLLIETQSVTFAEFTPYVLRKLIAYCEKLKKNLHTFNTLICGSDVWTVFEYHSFKQYLKPGARLVNTYGLTETTIDSTAYEDSQDNELTPDMVVPIGVSLPHIKVFLIDDKNNVLTKKGHVGEICIAGDTVSQGYVNEALNHKKFISLTIGGDQLKVFKTGDYGSYLSDGLLQLIGRKDSQVKYYGKRIELAFIECILNQHPKIAGSMVTLINSYHRPSLIAYIKVIDSYELDEKELKLFMRSKSKEVLLPAEFYYVEKIPINQNGKVMRQAMAGKLVLTKRVLKHIKEKTGT